MLLEVDSSMLASHHESISKCFLSLSIVGNHHHLPICCGCTAALHAVSAPGWSSYPQTWPLHPAAAQWGGLWGNHSEQHILYMLKLIQSIRVFHFSWMSSPSVNLLLVFCARVFRRCVRRWTAARQEETQCWSGLREHSSAGKSRSRNSARLFLTATRCLVKPYSWPQNRFRIGNFTGLSTIALAPAALLLTSFHWMCTPPSELQFPH